VAFIHSDLDSHPYRRRHYGNQEKIMTKKVALYLRVSTTQQTVENQRLELEKYCQRQDWVIAKTYNDTGISGSKSDRPALNEMLQDAAKGKFSVLVVWKIDRLARSTTDLLNILLTLKNYGVDFCSTTQAIDTTTSMGRMIMVFLGAIAEFERDTIIERVNAGLSRARANGVKLGRPRVGFDVNEALRMRDQEGLGYKQIAKALGIPRTTLYRTLGAIPKTLMA
jgi:DNA invertase Pin-like site-specific DNA recombinase